MYEWVLLPPGNSHFPLGRPVAGSISTPSARIEIVENRFCFIEFAGEYKTVIPHAVRHEGH